MKRVFVPMPTGRGELEYLSKRGVDVDAVHKRKLAHPEQDIQRAVWNWARWHRVGGTEAEPVHLSDYLIHVPSGGKRSKVEAAIMRGLGAPRGFPDLLLLLPCVESDSDRSPQYCAAVLELKVPGEYPNEDQRQWLKRLDRAGYAAGWTDTAEAAREFFRRYLTGTLIIGDPLKRWGRGHPGTRRHHRLLSTNSAGEDHSMRPYQLEPDGVWLDLDTVQSIKPPWIQGSGPSHTVVLAWWHAFQDQARSRAWYAGNPDAARAALEHIRREVYEPFLRAWTGSNLPPHDEALDRALSGDDG